MLVVVISGSNGLEHERLIQWTDMMLGNEREEYGSIDDLFELGFSIVELCDRKL